MTEAGARGKCAECRGTGLTRQVERVTCPGCDGTGAIHKAACIHCDGSGGEDFSFEFTCPQCGGAGYFVTVALFGRSRSFGGDQGWADRLSSQNHQAESKTMSSEPRNESLGLEFCMQRPNAESVDQLPASRDTEGRVLYPELDADGDHVHFEMVPMGGDSLLWLTIRRGISPQLAASSLRKIAGLIERHGSSLLQLVEGSEGSINSEGDVVSGPLRLDYDANGDLIIPGDRERRGLDV
jgi:hypothetical protein